MQVSQPPCSLSDSPKAKTTSSGTTPAKIHTSINNRGPIEIRPGEARRHGLLSGRTRALDVVDDHVISLRYHTTLIKPSHSFISDAPLQLTEEEDVSEFQFRPFSPRHAPLSVSETEAGAHPEFFPTPPRRFVVLEDSTPSSPSSPRERILTRPSALDASMMPSILNVPEVPPDLTDSRSSKCSSYGSLSSHVDDFSTQITNFEEIGLDDDDDDSNEEIKSETRGEPHQARVAPYFTARRTTVTDLRATNKKEQTTGPKSAGLELQKSGFKSPTDGGFLAAQARLRSTSPPYRAPRSASSLSFGGTTFTGPSPRSSFAPPSRRGSWQPRKTAAEIEAEYHDSDDELPEDASLWNVPISPFPTAGSRSALSSARGSLERPPAQNPQPIPLEHMRSKPDSPPGPRRAMTTQALTRHRLTPRASSSNLARPEPTSPPLPSPPSRIGRAKSWNIAMSDLSAEARIISQNLECHAASHGDLDDKMLPPIPHRSSAPSVIQLPPIQRGPLDFMPVSKEKEAILSRTRPSWLPPKDPREEKKHLREYQRMMAAAVKADKEREREMETTNFKTDDVKVRLNRIWQYYVEPSTDLVNIDRRVHGLCWKGVTPRLRGKVWQRTLGNSLGLTPTAYQIALDRAREIKHKQPQDLSREEKNMSHAFADIERDAETAFPDLKLFQRKGPLRQDLINICEAHACYRSDVGYVYGVQLMSALILLQVPDAADAFVLLENCLNNPIPSAFQTRDSASQQRTYNRVISTLGVKFPRLHDYLFGTPERGGLGLTGEEVLETMFRTMFSNGLDVDRLCRVWDIWMFEGDRTLVRTAVAILGSLQTQILDVQGDVHLKRRNIQEMLGWGPFNRTPVGGHWAFDSHATEDKLVEEIRLAGKLDYTGR